MAIPFTREQFFGVFAHYNAAVWPAQVALTVLAAFVIVLIVRGRPGNGRWIGAALSLLWAWMAVAYHFVFFADINPAAKGFAAAFLIAALLFAWQGTLRGRYDYAARAGFRGWLGGSLILFALLVYPALGWLLGHRYPAVPSFGLPCPTTIFTLGVLMFVRGELPRLLLLVPLLWAAVGSTAAFALGVTQDLGLLAAGVLALLAMHLGINRGQGHDVELG
jgi:hypothetical protein